MNNLTERMILPSKFSRGEKILFNPEKEDLEKRNGCKLKKVRIEIEPTKDHFKNSAT